MKWWKNITILMLALSLSIFAFGCEDEVEPIEDTEDAMEDVGEEVEDTAEDVEDEVDDMTDENEQNSLLLEIEQNFRLA